MLSYTQVVFVYSFTNIDYMYIQSRTGYGKACSGCKHMFFFYIRVVFRAGLTDFVLAKTGVSRIRIPRYIGTVVIQARRHRRTKSSEYN